MPTNDERREAAGMVRRAGNQSPYAWQTIRGILGMPEGYTIPQIQKHLAELIEPEPERTCHMTKIGGDRILAGWWECSECGPVYPPCKDEIAKWALQRCPRCGARVVVE